MSDLKDRQDVSMGRNASEVLDNPAFIEAKKLMDEAIFLTFKDVPKKDTEGILLMHKYAQVADDFYRVLTGLIERGKLAQHRINVDELRDENALKRAARKFF